MTASQEHEDCGCHCTVKKSLGMCGCIRERKVWAICVPFSVDALCEQESAVCVQGV